jgi:FAD/FMN-containing dehydrogenase
LRSAHASITRSTGSVARQVRVGAGVKWERVAPRLSTHGLAGLHGSSPDVGIAGYSLGGGMGWLARKYGLQTNAVTALELVTADGDLVRTDAVHEPDLFWALRSGVGNFGVVTAIEFSVTRSRRSTPARCSFPSSARPSFGTPGESFCPRSLRSS